MWGNSLAAGFIYTTFIYPLIYVIPAYVANGAPVLFGGKRPLDFGRKLRGVRVFGSNKTVRGTISSLLAGTAIGAIELIFFPWMLAVGILSALGANAGDLLGSFLKRQMRKKPGAGVPILDQYGFLLFALLFAWPLGHTPTIYGLIFIVALTGAAHVLTNRGAYLLKLKRNPW